MLVLVLLRARYYLCVYALSVRVCLCGACVCVVCAVGVFEFFFDRFVVCLSVSCVWLFSVYV